MRRASFTGTKFDGGGKVKGGHMVVIHGLQEFNSQTIGYYIQDPDASFKGHNYFLTREEFTAGWRGGLIYQDSIEEEKVS